MTSPASAAIEFTRTASIRLARRERGGHLRTNLVRVSPRRVDLLATPGRAGLADRIAATLGDLEIHRKPLEHRYYAGGLRYMIWVTAPDGAEVPLIDGGSFDWLAELTSNRPAVYIASAPAHS